MLLHLLPVAAHIEDITCNSRLARVPRSVAPQFDSGARAEIDERWQALGVGLLRTVGAAADIRVAYDRALGAQAYRLIVKDGRASITGGDSDGAFYGAMTLAQLPVRVHGGAWTMPCVRVEDRPALRWRILSDDVSRGPLPTMRYFEERIRTIAAFKMNGYSPYMEHVFVSPTDPLPAPLDGITPEQLHDLTQYAARFHVALIPEQQTFAHMHNTLRIERYAAAAELPHGFLLAPNVALSMEYLSRLVTQELAAVGRPLFFHIGSDETATLGLGQTQAYVAQRGRSEAYAQHIVSMNRLVAPSGARIMLWDDGIENDPSIMNRIPRTAVIVNWHYADEPTYVPYIETVARGGFDQMVAPGARNWNEIFPNVTAAIENEQRFILEGQAARVMGVFQTVWHDDGETLYEATWYPVLYAAAQAWQPGVLQEHQFREAFPRAFFGSDDAAYGTDVDDLAKVLAALEPQNAAYGQTDALFWADPFDRAANAQLATTDLRQVRLAAEEAEQHLYFSRPLLHGDAAFAMFLAARRYDALARKFQIAAEVRAMYADARAHAASDRETAERDLRWCQYWMWELRDGYEDLAPLYARAWTYESRAGHLASNLERYHMAAQTAIARADAFSRLIGSYGHGGTLPPFDTVVAP